jgi:Ca2+-binding RTX toxin-like protein
MKMTTNSLLSQAQSQAQIELQKFAQQPDFLAQLQVAFGDDFDQNIALGIANQFRSGDFSLIPDVRVLTNGELGDANGAYAGDLDEIFVSSDFLAQRQGDVPAITNLLLEEFGHKLDRLLNGNVDSPGDEGAIFAALAQGQTLSTDALAQLRAEDDHRTIAVDGKLVSIEMENWTGTSGDDFHIGVDASNTLNGLAGNDTLYGGTGDDSIYGGGGNDILVGYSGNDYLYGMTGNDTYIFNAAYETGADFVDEAFFGDGIDTLDFSSYTIFPQDIKVDLSSTTIQTVAPGFQLTLLGSLENVIGGAGNDTLYGNSLDNTLYGGDGNDILYGDTGNDYLYGGAGNDTLSGGYGNNTFSGGAGNDDLYGWSGNDTYIFNAAIDTGVDKVDETYGGGIDTLDFSTTTTQDINVNLSSTTLQTVAPGFQITLLGSIENVIGGGGNDNIFGNSLNNTLNGGAGNDYLYGSDGSDLIYGGTGDDYLSGGTGDDYLDGDAGNDYLRGFIGDDYLAGGAGNDYLDGEDGNDTLSGGTDNDTLSGGSGNDYLYGGYNNDTLYGGTGDNTLYGDAGNDTYIFNAAYETGANIVDETFGDGIDTLNFSNNPFSQQAIDVSLSSTTIQTIAPGLQLTLLGSIENVIGGAGNDHIYGNNLDNTLNGGFGNDVLYGGNGNDTLIGGAGDDYLVDDGSGNDTFYGGDGNDTLAGGYSGSDSNTFNGGSGNDTYLFTPAIGSVYIVDEAGGDGIDTLNFSSITAQNINVNLSATTIQTIAPGVQLTTYGSIENVISGYGNDNIYGNSLDNTLDGGVGNDYLYGDAGNDTLLGGNGGDILDGGAGNDSLNGGLGDDFLGDYGGGNDLIVGGDGNDGLYGGAGTDTLIGGMGNDSYYLSYVPSDLTNDTITENLGEGIDTAYAIFTVTALAANVENLSLLGTGNINGTGNSLDNQILGNAGNNTLDGGAGNDFIANFYNTGSNTLIGGDGNDILYGGGANDTLIGGNGNDTYYYSLVSTELATDTFVETATGGYDTAITASSVTQLADNIETLYFVGTADINGTGNSGDNLILGNSGNNSLFGGAGNDFLGDYAGGNDTFNGGAGNDILFGGTGIDSFVFSGNSLLSFQTALGVDNIADFTVGDDIILLSKGNFGSLTTAAGNLLLSADFATVTTDTATTLGSSIVYNSANGKLFYDANGAAAGFGTGGQFAQLSSGLGLTGNQFKAIA